MLGSERTCSTMNKRRRQNKKPIKQLCKDLKPVITIDESAGECLFLIVDFISPLDGNVRRVISKRLPNGNIEAVLYDGPVGEDGLHTEKRNFMGLKDVTEKKFLFTLKVLQDIYGAVGGEINIRNYDKRSLNEVAVLMKLTDSGNVFFLDDEGNLKKR